MINHDPRPTKPWFFYCQKHGILQERFFIKKGKTKRGTQCYACVHCRQVIRRNNYLKNKAKIIARNTRNKNIKKMSLHPSL